MKFSTKYINYLIVSTLVIVLVLFMKMSKQERLQIRKLVKNPNVLILLIASIGVLSFYNIYLAMACMGSLLIILTTKEEGDDIKAINTTQTNYTNKSNVNVEEGFESNRKHALLKNFGIDMKEMTNDLMDGLAENRRSNIRKRNKKISKFNDKKKEGFNDTGMINIPKRKFNPEKESDINLMETRKILEDLINRIDYKYEDNDYLKKYIGSRIEEIVDLNDLLEED